MDCAAKGSSCQEALSDLASELPDRVELESPAQKFAVLQTLARFGSLGSKSETLTFWRRKLGLV